MAKSLGHEIKRVRELRGLSLGAVSKPAGVSPAYIQKLERDQVTSPSPHRLQRVAQALGIEYAELYRLARYPNPIEDSAAAEADPSAPGVPVSPLRRLLLDEKEVTDDEIEQLVRYLAFIRRNPSNAG